MELSLLCALHSLCDNRKGGIAVNPESNEMLTGGLSLLIVLLVLTFMIRLVITNIKLYFARKAVQKNPTLENAQKVYKLLSRFGVTINNHPKDWGKYRDMFYQINGSDQIPTELKEQLKRRLVKKGLYINNMRIIDNYKPSVSQKS